MEPAKPHEHADALLGEATPVRRRQSIFRRRPTCKELCLFPTPIVWALIFGGTNYSECPAIPYATSTIMACSSAALLNETLRFAFRLPLAPWEEPRSILVWLSAVLQAATVGLACWGAVLTFPQTARLAHGGGEGCNVPAFATAFLCAALTLLSNAIIGLVLLHRWRHRRRRAARTMVPDELAAALREGRVVASVGAGFTRAAGLPDWEELLRGMIDDCGIAADVRMPSSEDFSAMPYGMRDLLQSEIIEKAGRVRACASMDRRLQALGPSEEMERRLEALFALPLAAVITWNWDDVLSARCAVVGGGGPPDPHRRCEGEFFAQLASPGGSAPPPLLKMQGSLANAASVVLDAQDYQRVRPHRDAFIRRLYVDSDLVVLHIGQGLGGLSGGALGPVLVEQPVRHFALVSEDVDTPEEDFLRERGIGVLRYSASAGHSEGMCGLLAAFARAAAAR